MAITIHSSPNFTEYAYNDFHYGISSSLSNNLSFKFVVDYYKINPLTSAETFLTRIKVPTAPTAITYINPSRILENYVSNKFQPFIAGVSGASECVLNYRVYYGEEFDASASSSAATGTTIIFNTATTSSVAWTVNAVKQYDQPYNLLDYVNNGSTTQFLTNQTERTIRPEDYETLSVMYGAVASASTVYNYLRIETFDDTHGWIGSFAILFTGLTNVILNKRFDVPSGIQQMSAWTSWNYALGGDSGVLWHPDFEMIDEYKMWFVSSSSQYTGTDSGWGTYITSAVTYRVDHSCVPRGDIYKLAFVNRLGATDYLTMYGTTFAKTLEIERAMFSKQLPVGYSVGDRGRNVYTQSAKKILKLYSGWVTKDKAEIFEELVTSSEIYIQDNVNQQLIPIIATSKEFQIKSNNKKLLEYTIEFEYANDVNLQRN